ncbi:hypothetical protein [Okeania sp. SIO1I7]|uniref:hypothetical protein n=1 Tax=Okeania sp. SIO1I7 TaxID=2607772 RepID=UPI0013F799AE|nr:hypothetical protein [Okeania sp. SIO1I7]NET26005.1 hypothetical protein [Okeania sp. SIO1I7]
MLYHIRIISDEKTFSRKRLFFPSASCLLPPAFLPPKCKYSTGHDISRAGKSRLANLVFQQTRCTVVHLDSFFNAVRNNYPAPILTPREKKIFQDYCDTVLVKAIRNMGKGRC